MFLLLNSRSVTTLEVEILYEREFDLDFLRHLIKLKILKINAKNQITYINFQRISSLIFKIQDIIGGLRSLQNLLLCEIPEVYLNKVIVEAKKLPLLKNLSA